MAWIDPNAHVCSFAFFDAKGTRDTTIDLFPSRITFHRAPDDFIGLLAASMLNKGQRKHWASYIFLGLDEGFEHPVANGTRNAVLVHKQTPLPNALVWVLQGEHVVSPDGRSWPTQAFCGAPGFFWIPNDRIKKDLPFQNDTTEEAVVAAVLRMSEMDPHIDVVALCCFVVEWMARRWTLLFSEDNPSDCGKLAGHTALLAQETDLLRAEPSFAPTKLVVDTTRLPSNKDSLELERVAQHMVRLVLASGVPIGALAYEHRSRQSAHLALQVTALERTVSNFLSTQHIPNNA